MTNGGGRHDSADSLREKRSANTKKETSNLATKPVQDAANLREQATQAQRKCGWATAFALDSIAEQLQRKSSSPGAGDNRGTVVATHFQL